MASLALAARVLLALVFGTAAVGKFADQAGTRRALADFGAPEGSLKVFGVLLPLAELATAVALLFQPTARFGAIVAIVLVVIFVAGIIRAMARGEAPDCHCFGQISSSPAGPRTLLRNAVLMAPAIFIVAYGPGTSIDAWVSARSAAELVAVATGAAAVLLAGICIRLWRTNRELREDLDRAKESLAAFPPGLPVGAPAPAFALPDVDGRTRTLEALLASGKPVALVFVSPACDACRVMLPDLARWQATLPDQITIALVGAGDKEELRELAEGYGLTNMLIQDDAEVFHTFRAAATPSVVIVGADGRIASPTRSTHVLVETLLRRAVRSNGTPVEPPAPNGETSNARVVRLSDPTDLPADRG